MPTGRPDWFGTIVAAGKYGTTYIPIALDVDGFITATMKGLYDSDALLKTIAVDSGGIMKANLSVQDLDFLTVRPAYGEALRTASTVVCAGGETTTLKTLLGRGIIYGGMIRWTAAVSRTDINTRLDIDGVLFFENTIATMHERGWYNPDASPVFIVYFDDVNFLYITAPSHRITFESTAAFKIVNTGAGISVFYEIWYALAP